MQVSTQQASREFLSAKSERVLLWLSVGLISLIAFEALAVATAMPTVVTALDGANLYALAMGVPLATQLMTTAIAGPWSDSVSPQSCLYIGLAGFVSGLVIATFSPTMVIFVVGRAVQGLGAGLCIVPIYALIGNNVRPMRQPAFFAAFAAAWVVPGLIGPAIAGILVENTSWRLVFGIVPALLLFAAPILVTTTRRIPHSQSPSDTSRIRTTVLCACATGISLAVLQVMSGTESGGFTPLTYTAIVISSILAFVFIKPLLPRGTFISRRGLASTVLLRGLINGAFLGVEAFLPLLLQDVHGWSPAQAGLILTVGSVTWALGSSVQARVRSQHQRTFLPAAGTFLQLVGIAIACLGSIPGISGVVVIMGWTLSGFGIGLAFPALSVHSLAMTPPQRQGSTSASIQLADNLGAAFCVAIAGIVHALLLPDTAHAFMGAFGLMAGVTLIAVVIAFRVQPHPGSQEAEQLAITSQRQASDS